MKPTKQLPTLASAVIVSKFLIDNNKEAIQNYHNLTINIGTNDVVLLKYLNKLFLSLNLSYTESFKDYENKSKLNESF